MGDSIKGRYDIILGRDLLATLGFDLRFSFCVMIGGKVPYEGYLSPMVDERNFYYTPLTDKIINLEESFLNFYVDECFKSENLINPNQLMCIILDAEYKKADLNMVITSNVNTYLPNNNKYY